VLFRSQPDEDVLKARAAARKAVQISPSSHSAWLVLGWVQRLQGELRVADESIEKAIALNPNDSDSYVFQANIKIVLGEPEEAIRLVEQAIALTTQTPDWHRVSRGAALYAARRYQDAVNCLEAIESIGMATRFRAMSEAQLGHDEEAKRAVAVYCEQYPAFSIAKDLAKLNYRNDEDLDHYAEGMRKAGFPA